MFARSAPSTIFVPGPTRGHGLAADRLAMLPLQPPPAARLHFGFGLSLSLRNRDVFSFLGVLVITVVLFLVVALTARLILGK